jgi:hypothetical protein
MAIHGRGIPAVVIQELQERNYTFEKMLRFPFIDGPYKLVQCDEAETALMNDRTRFLRFTLWEAEYNRGPLMEEVPWWR